MKNQNKDRILKTKALKTIRYLDTLKKVCDGIFYIFLFEKNKKEWELIHTILIHGGNIHNEKLV